MSVPKPFQEAAVDAALSAFANQAGRRRFLVADEVGLGKTVVAKEVARRMADDGRRPLVIYYVANGHAVSHQNKGRIVSFLDDGQLEKATKTPDRLSLIAVAKRPDNPVLIYALTPATSFPGARAPNRQAQGRARVPESAARASLSCIRTGSRSGHLAAECAGILGLGRQGRGDEIREFARPSHAAVSRSACGGVREPVRAKLELAVLGDAEKKIKPLKPTTFVGHLRRALALATLRHQPPDLVILDEFQRYRQILEEKDADPLLKALLEPANSTVPPAILLLSATPYRLLSTRWEETKVRSHTPSFSN